MFETRGRAVVTSAVVLEVGIAGWYIGHGLVWLLAMTAVVTLADTAWGVIRRRILCDVAGVEVAATLAILLVLGADPALSLLVGLACLAWLVRPERQPVVQPTGAA
jgi:hypothetical protein